MTKLYLTLSLIILSLTVWTIVAIEIVNYLKEDVKI
jgi:hypothetical protein